MTIEKLNLNLVPVLRALLRERSVSGAAALLGRSPSAVSENLAQLRTILGDQILVRVGAHLRLTSRAANLLGPVEEAHERLQSLFRSGKFDPQLSTRTFFIASSDLLISEVGPDIIKIIRTHAPKMSLRFLDIAHGLTEKMAKREIDFALLPHFAVNDLAPAPMRFKSLYEAKLTALMSREHPLAKQRSVSIEDVRAYRHIAFQPDGVLLEGRRNLPPRGSGAYDTVGEFDRAVAVNQFLTIPRLLEGTDLLAIVPSQIADAALKSASVVAVALAYQVDSSLLGIAWSPVYDRDDAHAWLRKFLTDRRKLKAAQPATSRSKGDGLDRGRWAAR